MGYKLIRKSPYFKRSVLNYDQDVNKNWKGSSLSKLALLDAEKGLHVVTPTIWLPSKPDSHITSIEARYNGISFWVRLLNSDDEVNKNLRIIASKFWH